MWKKEKVKNKCISSVFLQTMFANNSNSNTQILIESDSNKNWVQNFFLNFFKKILIDLAKNDNK